MKGKVFDKRILPAFSFDDFSWAGSFLTLMISLPSSDESEKESRDSLYTWLADSFISRANRCLKGSDRKLLACLSFIICFSVDALSLHVSFLFFLSGINRLTNN